MAAQANRSALRKVLAINLFQSLAGGGVGAWAQSTALVGAALDNLGDAGVYGISLYAEGRSAAHKARAARISGWLLVGFSLMLAFEVLRRFFSGAEPIGVAMMIWAACNAALNLVCLKLLRSHRREGAHFAASWIFTSNDTLVNLGIVASGALVLWLESPLPDLVIGLLVAAIAFRGGREILEIAEEASKSSSTS
ncbi:cation transporter [Solimonas fluminis]|uniref:Cation transporter n=2 Tax=Nevskiaceae TaxID=568386 RepID=A0A2S5TCT2_9GAMM|nr:cation transporter [Solimonas fluminis]